MISYLTLHIDLIKEIIEWQGMILLKNEIINQVDLDKVGMI